MRVTGTVVAPGDKSITHRVLLLAALAQSDEPSRIRGGLTSLDARSTARVLRALGAVISPLRPGAELRVVSRGLNSPAGVLHCGNSGTTARLGLGALAGLSVSATLTGDRSLRNRPMRRVVEPLEAMGARFSALRDGLPLTIHGGSLTPLAWQLPVSSAQLKSALLLAGVTGGVPVRVQEPTGRSRDHTERLLRAFGYRVEDGVDGWITFAPTGRVTPFDVHVPGDISSAAFLIGAATLAESGELRVASVGVNPTRTGFLDVLARMGATVPREGQREVCGEPVADLIAGPASLRATVVEAQEIPGLIDEIPMLAVLASRAEGTTVFREVGELRVKESDRLALIAHNLQALGVDARSEGNTLYVTGTDAPPRGRVVTEGDHRIAMAFGVLGRIRGARVSVDDPGCAEVSFPGFDRTLELIGGQAAL